MGKITVDLSYDFLSFNSADSESLLDFAPAKTLSDCVKYLELNNCDSYFCFSTNEDISDKKIRTIAMQLAQAIDNNSVEEIKSLKKEYGNDSEFAKAKKYLDKKCKEVWNVYELKNMTVPYEAMKTLGITNQPSLDSLLFNTVKFFEKDNGNTTAKTIDSILNNKNLKYTIEDIHNYLVLMCKKERCKYNLKTLQYLVEKQNYSAAQLYELGFSQKEIFSLFKMVDIKHKVALVISDFKNISDLFLKSAKYAVK